VLATISYNKIPLSQIEIAFPTSRKDVNVDVLLPTVCVPSIVTVIFATSEISPPIQISSPVPGVPAEVSLTSTKENNDPPLSAAKDVVPDPLAILAFILYLFAEVVVYVYGVAHLKNIQLVTSYLGQYPERLATVLVWLATVVQVETPSYSCKLKVIVPAVPTPVIWTKTPWLLFVVLGAVNVADNVVFAEDDILIFVLAWIVGVLLTEDHVIVENVPDATAALIAQYPVVGNKDNNPKISSFFKKFIKKYFQSVFLFRL
jgi:hypothetical protein